jgi:hypothetical protein
VRALIERCKREVWRQFNVRLREEIVYLGFDPPPVAVGGTPGHPEGAED